MITRTCRHAQTPRRDPIGTTHRKNRHVLPDVGGPVDATSRHRLHMRSRRSGRYRADSVGLRAQMPAAQGAVVGRYGTSNRTRRTIHQELGCHGYVWSGAPIHVRARALLTEATCVVPVLYHSPTRMPYRASPATPNNRRNAAAVSATPASVSVINVFVCFGWSIMPLLCSRSRAAHAKLGHARVGASVPPAPRRPCVVRRRC